MTCAPPQRACPRRGRIGPVLMATMLGACSARGAEATQGSRRLPCADRTVGPAARIFLEVSPAAPGDSTAVVRLCVVPSSLPIGSYHATMDYDTAVLRVMHAEPGGNGLNAVNPRSEGTVAFAGATSSGFNAGAVATVTVLPRHLRTIGALKLTVFELNATSGADLRDGARVAGYPSSDRTLGAIGAPRVAAAVADSASVAPAAAKSRPSQKMLTWLAPPHIDSLSPAGATVARDVVIEVVIHGSGFSPAGNAVTFGSADLGTFPSADAKTIRFVVPSTMQSRSEVPPMRIGPGAFPVRVRNAGGQSNELTFTVRG
jgi:hypothetical protein